MHDSTNCRFTACPSPVVVQWQRRPTAEELAGLVAAETSRRAQILALANPEQPAPDFGPLPAAGDTVIAVFACADHTISIDAAGHVHAAGCRAPHSDHLPGCDCEPEPHPELPAVSIPTVTLPTGWIVPAPPAA